VDQSSHAERRRRLLFGRRKGPRLSAHQANLRATLLQRLRLPLGPDIDPGALFASGVADVWLEIGFGAGEHLLWQAQNHPDVGILAVEPYEAGVAKLLSKVFSLSAQGETRNPIPNLRIHEGDARDVLETLPEACLAKVFLLFPDPWPKTRHHKRRFIQMDVLDALARAMKQDAEFRFASDDAGYVEWTLERLLAHDSFVWMAERPQDWRRRPEDWPPTRYEQKALHGVPVFLRFRRGERRRGLLQTDGPKRR
jgi:tRNA (guanine-N7-)-methyltransferase